jgi:hypothetical protein
MKKRPFAYLRSHRVQWSLSARELGELLGARGASHTSRFETGERAPGGKVLLACEIIFGATPRDLFPGLHEHIEEIVMGRAAKLYKKLEGKTDKRSLRKRELLELMTQRAVHNSRV